LTRRAWTSGQGKRRCESVDILARRFLFSDPTRVGKILNGDDQQNKGRNTTKKRQQFV
jgi:hypothetical protein